MIGSFNDREPGKEKRYCVLSHGNIIGKKNTLIENRQKKKSLILLCVLQVGLSCKIRGYSPRKRNK
jgi:hypothetical protein